MAVDSKPVTDVTPAPDANPQTRRDVPAILTGRAKVEQAALQKPNGTPAQIAALAGVSESTVRRYMPNGPMASPSGGAPAVTVLNGHTTHLVNALMTPRRASAAIRQTGAFAFLASVELPL